MPEAPRNSSRAVTTRSYHASSRRSPSGVLIPDQANNLHSIHKAFAEYVIDLYSARMLRRRIHDSSMTGEQKVSEWLERHPAAMHSQLGLNPATFSLVLRDLETLGGLRPRRQVSTRVELAIFL